MTVWALFLFGWCLAAVHGADDPLTFPGVTYPPPRQRNITDIEEMPQRELACPVCAYSVLAPQIDLLMRRPDGAEPDDHIRWQMDAASRDADLAPHPATGKIRYQADLVLCPSCGYAENGSQFEMPVSPALSEWIRSTLTPRVREAENLLMASRAGELADAELVEFFNDQAALPDFIRTDHHRVITAWRRAPFLEQAKATWQTAWSLRRESTALPHSRFLAGAAASVMKKAGLPATSIDPSKQIEKLSPLLARTGRLNADENFAARLLRSAAYIRLGYLDKAEEELLHLLEASRERFIRADQDPLYPMTASEGNRERRYLVLETLRTDLENMITARLDQVVAERDTLEDAAVLLRQALMAGEMNAKTDEALFYGFLTGEFLRRSGNLPLAAEWFANVSNLIQDNTPLAAAVAQGLEGIHRQAGDSVNLLAGLGKDGQEFEKLREIVSPRTAPVRQR